MSRIELTVLLDEEGGVSVRGPVQDKVLCYGLLEGAKDAIKAWHEAQNKSSLVTPNGSGILTLTPQ